MTTDSVILYIPLVGARCCGASVESALRAADEPGLMTSVMDPIGWRLGPQ
jgi:hypothetical protein